MSKQTDLINIPDAITVTSNEKVGLGTDNPLSSVHMAASSGVTGYGNSILLIEDTGGDYSGVMFKGSTNYNAAIRTEGSSAMTFWRGDTSGTPYFVKTMRIDSDGLKFNSDTAAANALDDYEEGTFTPAISGLTFTTAAGLYVKVGRACHVTINMEGANTSKTGDIYISGLPFNAITNSSLMPVNSVPIMEVANVNLTGSYINMYGRINSADNRLQLLQSSGVSHASMAAGGGISAGGVLRTSFTYQTA